MEGGGAEPGEWSRQDFEIVLPPNQLRRESEPSAYRSHSSSQSSAPPEYLSRSQWGASTGSINRIRTDSSSRAPQLMANGVGTPAQAHQQRSSTPPPEKQPHPKAALHFAPESKPSALSANAGRPDFNRQHSAAGSDSEWDEPGQTYDDDDYDWDNDDDIEGDARFDDLAPAVGGGYSAHQRRKPIGRRFSPYSLIKWFITTFVGNIIISLLLLVPPFVLRYAGYYKQGDDPASQHTQYVYDNVAAWCFWASFNNMAAWGLHFAIELFPRLLVMLVHLIWGDVNERLKGWIEIFHAAKGWVKPPFYAAMAWGSWAIIFTGIFHLRDNTDPSTSSRAPYTYRLYQVVALMFFFILILSIEKLVILAISLNFHRVAYADRINKTTNALGILDKLRDYRPKRKAARPASSRNASTEFLGTFRPGHGRPKSGAATPPTSFPPAVTTAPPKKHRWWRRRSSEEYDDVELAPRTKGSPTDSPANLSKENLAAETPSGNATQAPSVGGDMLKGQNQGTKLGSFFSRRGANAAQIARAAMKDPLAVVGKRSGFAIDVNSPLEAKHLARSLFRAFKTDPKRAYLIPSDLFPAFPTEEKAREAFELFDRDGNGDITRTEIKNRLMHIYKERRALARSLADVQHAIRRLDGILLGLSAIVLLFVALAVFGVDYSKALTSVYTIGVAAAFIFKETASNVFDAIIMVFCTHPFDTGDRIFMDNDGVEEILVVKRMGLLVTVFERWDGTEWFAPNALLGQKIITNLRRSDKQFENATLQIGWQTPLSKLTDLETKMNLWLSTDEERRFAPSTACVIQHLVNNQYMEVTVGMVHCDNWQDWGARWSRRTAFHAALNHYTRELGITFYNPEQPIHYRVSDLDKLPEYDSGSNPDDDSRSPLFSPSPVDDDADETAVEAQLPEERPPPAMGFRPPPEEGTGVRRRKKLSRKKMMFGDA